MDAFPSRTDDLPRAEAIRQTFGFWPAVIGAGLLATAALVAIGEDEALAIPKGLASEGILVALGALFALREVRKRRGRVTLALRPGELAVHRSGALTCVRPLGAARSILLDVGASLRNLLCSLGAALIPGVVAVRQSGVERAAGVTWTLVFLAGALSVVHTRFRCRHFSVPVGDRDLRIAVRAVDGDRLLEALPRTGNWQVAE